MEKLGLKISLAIALAHFCSGEFGKSFGGFPSHGSLIIPHPAPSYSRVLRHAAPRTSIDQRGYSSGRGDYSGLVAAGYAGSMRGGYAKSYSSGRNAGMSSDTRSEASHPRSSIPTVYTSSGHTSGSYTGGPGMYEGNSRSLKRSRSNHHQRNYGYSDGSSRTYVGGYGDSHGAYSGIYGGPRGGNVGSYVGGYSGTVGDRSYSSGYTGSPGGYTGVYGGPQDGYSTGNIHRGSHSG